VCVCVCVCVWVCVCVCVCVCCVAQWCNCYDVHMSCIQWSHSQPFYILPCQQVVHTCSENCLRSPVWTSGVGRSILGLSLPSSASGNCEWPLLVHWNCLFVSNQGAGVQRVARKRSISFKYHIVYYCIVVIKRHAGWAVNSRHRFRHIWMSLLNYFLMHC